MKCEKVLKIQEGRPNAGDMLKNGDINMLMLTTTGVGFLCQLIWLMQPPQCKSIAAEPQPRPRPPAWDILLIPVAD